MSDTKEKSENLKLRCVDCRAEFELTEGEIKESGGCPECGSVSTPSRVDRDVEVRINWLELQALANWAANHVVGAELAGATEGAITTVNAVIAALENQRPEGFPPLTAVNERAFARVVEQRTAITEKQAEQRKENEADAKELQERLQNLTAADDDGTRG
jgi:rRNA maturation endonuclease Nob1